MLKSYETKRLNLKGTRFYLDDHPFFLQGLSFFNALFNPAFNDSDETRAKWLSKFKEFGVNLLRIWCQWDLNPERRPFIDVDPDHTLYTSDGGIKEIYFERLRRLLAAADRLDMVVEITLFAKERFESPIAPFPLEAHERAAVSMAERLRPFRNVILQIWNENSTETRKWYDAVKRTDFLRIVTSSPGAEDDYLGNDDHNALVDVLTPHTNRREEEVVLVSNMQAEFLLEKYKKPVIDDEPFRCGTLQFGGRAGTTPDMHISQIRRLRELGGYHIYHHDMFQLGYGDPSIPPDGIPDPEFNPYHRQVFEYLRNNQEW